MSDDMTLSDAVEHLDRCSYADGDDICGRAIQSVREHARATTTPGDDRSRELARIADDLEVVADQMNGQMRGRAAAKWRRDAQTIRAIAAPAEPEAGDGELARTLRSLHSTLVRQVRDMGAERMEAWLYGVLVGWDCGADCEDPTDPEHACDGAMGELTQRFGWSRRDVAELRRLRGSVVAYLAAASGGTS